MDIRVVAFSTAALFAVAAQIYVFRLVLAGVYVGTPLPLVAVAALPLTLLAVLWRIGALRAVIAGWRGISRLQIFSTILLGSALHEYRSIVSINIEYDAFIFVGDQLKAFGLLLGFVAADGITGKDPDRRAVYALAILLHEAGLYDRTRIYATQRDASRMALLDAGIAAEISQTAGTFVCNHSFYGLMHELATNPALAGTRGGFIHVPWLPSQGQPSMPLEKIVAGLKVAIECALLTRSDIRKQAGALN